MKDKRLIILLFAVLAGLLLLYFTLNNTSEKRFQWNENYKTSSTQPYGTKFIKELLESYRPSGEFVFNDKKSLHDLLDSANTNNADADYVFIGRTLNLDEQDKEALLSFIFSGHDAFIASNDLPFSILDPVYVDECGRDIVLDQNQMKSATLNFYHDTLRVQKGYTYAYRFGAKDQLYTWNTLSPGIFCDSTKSIIPLGYHLPDRVNFFRLPYGSGNLYIHTNPIVFTNYFLSKPDKVEYASGVFSHLRGQSIIWDEFSKSHFTGSNDRYDSPLSYILEQKSLKYAWWMMLGCIVLYTLFAAKRKQRVIPVLEQKANTSLEFVNMISALHFQNTDHLDIAAKKMKYFLYFIRARYNMYTQHFTEAHLQRLAEKSKVELKDIQTIFDEYKIIEKKKYNDETAADHLVNLYNAIEKFYKQCK